MFTDELKLLLRLTLRKHWKLIEYNALNKLGVLSYLGFDVYEMLAIPSKSDSTVLNIIILRLQES